MRKIPFLAATGVVLMLTLAGCSSAADTMEEKPASSSSSSDSKSEEMESDKEMDAEKEDMAEARTGTFTGEGEKSLAGTATIADGKLMLTDFASSEGPDLHVYLTNGADADAIAAGMEIDLVAYDQASQTFALDGMDAADYSHVVIYCDKAKVSFGSAELM